MSKDILKQLEEQIANNPQQLFKENAGKMLSAPCPKCGEMTLVTTEEGAVKCTKCHITVDIQLEFN